MIGTPNPRPLPKYVERGPQQYVAVRARIPREALGSRAPGLLRELYSWLESHGVAAVDKPFIRYVVVDYNHSEVDIELGVPMPTSSLPEDDRFTRGVLPGGRYATVIHHGGYESLVETTAALLEWGKTHRVRWQVQERGKVTTWAGRVEHYRIGPDEEKDSTRWQTEVAILVAPEGDSAGGRRVARGPARR